MNRASKSTYTKKVMNKMREPILKLAEHVIRSDLGEPIPFKPPGYFGEI